MAALVTTAEIGAFSDSMIYCKERTIIKLNKIGAISLDLCLMLPQTNW